MPTLECPQLDLHSSASRAEAHEGTARQCPLPIDRPTAAEASSTVVMVRAGWMVYYNTKTTSIRRAAVALRAGPVVS